MICTTIVKKVIPGVAIALVMVTTSFQSQAITTKSGTMSSTRIVSSTNNGPGGNAHTGININMGGTTYTTPPQIVAPPSTPTAPMVPNNRTTRTSTVGAKNVNINVNNNTRVVRKQFRKRTRANRTKNRNW
jgi:hypothetical protein